METPILTPMQQAIELLRAKARAINDNKVVDRNRKGAYVDAIVILTDLLPKEQEAIEQAYKADMYPCSDEDARNYFNQTYKEHA